MCCTIAGRVQPPAQSATSRSLRKARISSPRIGCTGWAPFLGPGSQADHSAMHPYRDNAESFLRELRPVVSVSFKGSKERVPARSIDVAVTHVVGSADARV